MHNEKKEDVEIRISNTLLSKLNNLSNLERILKDCEKLASIPLLHYQAVRKVIYVGLYDESAAFEERLYALCEYREDGEFVRGRQFKPDEVYLD